MATLHEVIEAFRSEPTNSERGTKFEQLMVRYFELDPMLAQQYPQVWRWIDWPGRDGKADTGIDLVALDRDGGYTAIQCKFYEPTHTLAKGDIDSFFTASGKKGFTNRIIISTTDRWSKNAEDALDGQSIPVQRIGLAEIAEARIDWDIAWPSGELEVNLSPAKPHEARPHQQQAIDAVFNGFAAGNDRGTLVMACGTGKTFTALKIAERTAGENGGVARILFAVPSISLLSQTLREWTAQTQLDLRAFAVCSDTKVSRAAEDISAHDVAIPVTTDAAKLVEEMGHRKRATGLTVVFTTYQSLAVVAEAQRLGVDPFDLVICDEAHRTTGVTLAGADESSFVQVHDADFLKANRRLYMTATPRIFVDTIKDKAAQASAVLTSMDDEDVYGPEFHRLTFGEAVERGLLTDYKVIVLTVDESVIAGPLQKELAREHSELKLDDASKIVGCWNGLAKRGAQFAAGERPMRRAVAFAENIKTSTQIAEVFPAVVDAYRDLLAGHDDGANRDLTVEAHHVDGTFNALERNRELAWLKAPVPDGQCRVLSNARCLSEGVDVPALDAVLFLHPRNSQVDVVQSVGRVMRKADGKDYGYIILPVAVPAGVSPSQALSDNKRFKVVWDVLNALRSHDERFNAWVNSVALNSPDPKTGKGSDKILGDHIGPTSTEPGDNKPAKAEQLAMFSLSEWQEAIYARIVDKVGTRAYWEDWAADVADIANAQITRINQILDGASPKAAAAFDKFLQGLRDNLNDSITRDDAISMLSQHLITKPVFDALFPAHDFATKNPVSIVMQTMIDTLGDSGLEAETARLEGFYASVRRRAAEVTSAEGKQKVIAELYEKFFKLGFKKQSEALGIVYTPVEVVDFILRAADQALRDAFGRGLTDEGVHIIDPFTGTGTFIARLLQSGLITPADLARKYANELHANEIMLLAYYVAAVNIETTYQALAGEHCAFPGIVLADTFQITEDGDSMDFAMFPQNNDRIVAQLKVPINVVMGNPPYSVGQTSANDLNANVAYPTLDGRIAATYAKRGTAGLKRNLYDSYIRAFRWASDRIGSSGVVAFVSNGGWIDSNSADGMRLSLADEFARIYVYNLRGNQRTAGELSRREGGKIFGSGSRNTVAIFVGVKNPSGKQPCEVYYRDIGDYLSREEKLAIVAGESLDSATWEPIAPNVHGDWLNQRSVGFSDWPAIGSKSSTETTVFAKHSLGLGTNRDSWCYNFSRSRLNDAMHFMIDTYSAVQSELGSAAEAAGIMKLTPAAITELLQRSDLNAADERINWGRDLKQNLARGTALAFSEESVRLASYRPFMAQYAYFHRHTNNMIYQLESMFPTPKHENHGIVLTGPSSHFDFTPFFTNRLPDLHLLDTGQFFPRWTYEAGTVDDGAFDFGTGEKDEYGYRRIDNITDAIHVHYNSTIGEVTKDDIFYYVYGLLHVPSYREAYRADLKKMLPHIPTPASRERFEQLADAGRKLANLHVNYETVAEFPLEVQAKGDPADRETWRVQKMRFNKDKTAIIYNSKVTIAGIPAEAERYMIGPRSALAWIIDRYQVKTDKSSKITNDPNAWCDERDDPTCNVSLIKRVTTVAVETMKIVDSLSNRGGGAK
ncbi:MAG: DEAD/DEAH box helicase [Nocardiaceae bacterium]|nr:DEAD/DEAH box helicase [Nocardiaceae bacterium]